MTRTFPMSFLLFLLLMAITPGSAQTFNGQGGLPVPPGAPGQTVGITTSIATVSGIGILGNGCNNLDHITIDFTHTWVGDVALFLIAPTGQVVELSSGNGGAGDNFQVTTFTDNTTLFITQSTPPFNGSFRPEGRQQNTVPPFSNANPLGTFTFANTFNGLNADGNWTLFINDYVLADVGTLNSWSITFTSGGGPSPVVNLGPDVTICPGESTTLVADVVPDADTYLWNTGASSQSITVNPVVNTTYMVTVNNNGCIDADTINVIINANAITANAGADIAICAGNSTTLTGSGGGAGATYNWSSGQNGQSISVNPSSTTTYTLTVTDGGCTGTDQVVVTVNPTPNANAGIDQSICVGETANLTATGGAAANTYQWSTGQSGASINVSPVVTTTYTVTITINGCPDTDMVEIEVNPLPTVDVGPGVNICDGQSTVLSAEVSGGTIQWSTGQTSADITVSPSTTTTYTVTVTDNGCEATDNITVTVGDINGSIFGDDEICMGASTVLVGLGGTQYEWSTGESGSNILVTPPVTTTYTVTVSQGNCEDIVSIEVIVDLNPDLMLSDDITICSGETTTLTASGGNVYDWSNGAQLNSITVSPLVTSQYTVSVLLGNCNAIGTTQVTVNPDVDIELGPDLIICDGETITLNADGATDPVTYTWSTGASSMIISDQPAITTNYAVTVSNAWNCFDTDAVLVTVNPVPVASAGPDVFILSGGVTTLTATGGGIYLWSTGETSNVITVNPSATTTYTVTVTINNCSATDEVSVFVNQVPAVNLGADLIICEGESISIDATIPGPFNLQYQWSTGASMPMITIAPIVTTIFSVTTTDLTSGFATTDTVLVTVIPLLSGNPMLGGPAIVCRDSIETYTVNTIPGATTYAWTVSPGSQILSGQNTTSITVSWGAQTSGQVALVVSNDCNALPEVSLNVTVDQPPAQLASVLGPLNPCNAGTSSYSVISVPDQSYQWSLNGGSGTITNGQGTNNITIDWNGSVGADVCVVATNDCGSSSPYCISVLTTSTPILSAGSDVTICGLSATLNGTGTGEWTMLSGPGAIQFEDPNVGSTIAQASLPGLYKLQYAFNQNGCVASDEVVVEFFALPSIQQIASDCNAINTAYTISFEIIDGLAPYRVNGSPIAGSTYTSAEIISGSPYAFTVQDSRGCFSNALSGELTCNCTSASGVMEVTRIDACTDATVTATYLGGNIPDGNDTLVFVLHTGSFPGGIVGWNSIPEFSFAPPMQPEVTYFISAVIGDEGPGGLPQLSDPCISISPGTPVVFHLPPTANAGPDMTLGCTVSAISVIAIPSGNQQNLSYAWQARNGGAIQGKADTISILAGSAGTYILDVKDELSGCVVFDTSIVTKAFININGLVVQSEGPICEGECNGSVILSQVENDWTFDFGDGQFIPDVIYASACAGTFQLRVKDTYGCTADTSIFIEAPVPVLVDLGPDITIAYGDSVILKAETNSQVMTYNWFDANPCSTCQQIVVRPEGSNTYEVAITDDNGCAAQDMLTISVIFSEDFFIPNVFSPNQDQVNDVFLIPENNTLTFIRTLDIFDRWGNLVFKKKDFTPGDPTASWDGTFHGSIVSPGVYVYQLEGLLKNGKTLVRSGDLTVVR